VNKTLVCSILYLNAHLICRVVRPSIVRPRDRVAYGCFFFRGIRCVVGSGRSIVDVTSGGLRSTLEYARCEHSFAFMLSFEVIQV
jgi:hypothetical protein